MTALRDAFRFHLEHGGYIVGRRAECALFAARAEVRLRELIAAGLARVEVREDPEPWDGDVPYSGPLFILRVEVGRLEDSLGGIATSEDDVAAFFDPDGIQATAGDDLGGYAGQASLRGYLRSCAVEVAARLLDDLEPLDLYPVQVPIHLEDVGPAFAHLLKYIAEVHCAPFLATDLAAAGVSGASLSRFAEEWRRHAFEPADFADVLEALAPRYESATEESEDA